MLNNLHHHTQLWRVCSGVDMNCMILYAFGSGLSLNNFAKITSSAGRGRAGRGGGSFWRKDPAQGEKEVRTTP